MLSALDIAISGHTSISEVVALSGQVEDLLAYSNREDFSQPPEDQPSGPLQPHSLSDSPETTSLSGPAIDGLEFSLVDLELDESALENPSPKTPS